MGTGMGMTKNTRGLPVQTTTRHSLHFISYYICFISCFTLLVFIVPETYLSFCLAYYTNARILYPCPKPPSLLFSFCFTSIYSHYSVTYIVYLCVAFTSVVHYLVRR